MITKLSYLTLAAIVLIAFQTKADDGAWGSTNGGPLEEIDITTGQLQSLGPFNGNFYNKFPLFDIATNNALGSSLATANSSSGILYGLKTNGDLYTINTTLVQNVNRTVGFFVTKVRSLGVNVQGAVFVSSNLLDISTGSSLYQYNFATNTGVSLGNFVGGQIAGLTYSNGALYGVQYSPSPGGIDLISGVNLTQLLTQLSGSSFVGANSASGLVAGTFPILYLTDGNSTAYTYNLTARTQTVDPLFPGNLVGLTTSSDGGGGASPTPTPAPTATPAPTPTPTPGTTYKVPTGTLTVVAPETTPQLRCRQGYTYTASVAVTFSQTPIDPNGKLEVDRFYQSTSDGTTYSPATVPSAGSPAAAIVTWPWTIASFTSGNIPNCTAGLTYGKETLELVYTSPGNNATYILKNTAGTPATATIYTYPWQTGIQAFMPNATISNALTNAPVQGNPSPYTAPSPSPSLYGDPPRVTVQMNNLYPGATRSVIIYSGLPVSNPIPPGATTITIANPTAPNLAASGLWINTPLGNVPPATFELVPPVVPSSNVAQTYTIAAYQQLPAYPTDSTNPVILNTLTFTITPGFKVQAAVGTVQ